MASSPALLAVVLLALGMAVFYQVKRPKGLLLPVLSTALCVLAVAEAIWLGAETEEYTGILLLFLALSLMQEWRKV